MSICVKSQGPGWVSFTDGTMLYSNGDLDEEAVGRYIHCHYEVWEKPDGTFTGNLEKDNLYTLKVDDAIRERLVSIFTPTKDDILVEVGAYHGWGAVKMSKIVKMVYAFEADINNCYVIARNFRQNKIDNVYVSNVALSDKEGWATMYKGDHEQERSLHKRTIPKRKDTDRVYTFRGDGFVNKATYMTLEVNKAELDVLRGFENTLIDNNMRIISAGWYDDMYKEIKKYLESLGYVVYIGPVKRVYAYKP